MKQNKLLNIIMIFLCVTILSGCHAESTVAESSDTKAAETISETTEASEVSTKSVTVDTVQEENNTEAEKTHVFITCEKENIDHADISAYVYDDFIDDFTFKYTLLEDLFGFKKTNDSDVKELIHDAANCESCKVDDSDEYSQFEIAEGHDGIKYVTDDGKIFIIQKETSGILVFYIDGMRTKINPRKNLWLEGDEFLITPEVIKAILGCNATSTTINGPKHETYIDYSIR